MVKFFTRYFLPWGVCAITVLGHLGCRTMYRSSHRGSDDGVRAAPDESEAEAKPQRRPRRPGLLFGGGNENSENAELDTSKMPWPVKGTVSSEFGWRWGRLHSGIDIRARRGTPIVAPMGGRVAFASRSGGYGKLIIIDHGAFTTVYAHCHEIKVRTGQRIESGKVIGTVGSTGNASGSHLHFEVRRRGSKPVDPLAYLAPRDSIAGRKPGNQARSLMLGDARTGPRSPRAAAPSGRSRASAEL
jgi:murein DD-endopeptidase MepM/ murein hydrolase activator NlpD